MGNCRELSPDIRLHFDFYGGEIQGEKPEEKDQVAEDDCDSDPEWRPKRKRGDKEKTDVSAQEEYLVSERVKHLPQGCSLLQKTGQDSVERVSQSGDYEDRQRNEAKSFLLGGVGNKRDKKNRCKKDPKKGQIVRNAQELTVSVASAAAASASISAATFG